MSEFQLGPEEIIVHDEEEDEDVPGRIVMAVDKFGKCKSLLLNVSFFVCVVLCYFGFLVREQPIVENHLALCGGAHCDKCCAVQWAMENTSEFERMIAITGSVDRAATSNEESLRFVSSLAMNYTDNAGKTTLGSSGEGTLEFSFKKDARTSENVHIYTDVGHFYRWNEYRLLILDPESVLQRVDVTVTRVPVQISKIHMFVSCLMVVLIGTSYMLYRTQLADTVPPECVIFGVSMAFLVFGSDCWQFVIPHSDPRAVLFVTRTSQALLMWTQRLIVYMVAKGRNVMHRRIVSPVVIAFGAVAVMLEIMKAIVEVDYDFKYPFGKGTDLLQGMRVVSLVTLLIWSVLVVIKWERSPFLYAFFFCVLVGYVLGPVIDGTLGLFKDTLFRLYREAVLVVINFFLLVVTWPVLAHANASIPNNPHGAFF